MGNIIGIDLGTTNSVVAIYDHGRVTIIPVEGADVLLPSAVSFLETGGVLVGRAALNNAGAAPQTTVTSIKRFMGVGFNHPDADKARSKLPYSVVKGAKGSSVVAVRGKKLSPPEISARVLKKLKTAAEAYLGEPIEGAVITVPANFNETQRQATRAAGEIAGLTVERIINEPTAAALAYNLGMDAPRRLIAVYDFGGGTFDVSILDIGDGVEEVLASAGDPFLGGDDIDRAIMEWLRRGFAEANDGMNLPDKGIESFTVSRRIKDAAEKAKCELSTAETVEINLPFIMADTSGPKHLHATLTREVFEGLVAAIVAKTFEACGKAMRLTCEALSKRRGSRVERLRVDEVLLVGGSTRIPLVARRVAEFFGKTPRAGVNPDEVVAAGAAVQGARLDGTLSSRKGVLADVLARAIGIETLGGAMTVLFPVGAALDTKVYRKVTTTRHEQKQIRIRLLQGEAPIAVDCHEIGAFVLDGLPRKARGGVLVELTFHLGRDGTVAVTAVDQETKRSRNVTFEPPTDLDNTRIAAAAFELAIEVEHGTAA